MAIPKKLNKLKTWIIMNERFNQELIYIEATPSYKRPPWPRILFGLGFVAFIVYRLRTEERRWRAERTRQSSWSNGCAEWWETTGETPFDSLGKTSENPWVPVIYEIWVKPDMASSRGKTIQRTCLRGVQDIGKTWKIFFQGSISWISMVSLNFSGE